LYNLIIVDDEQIIRNFYSTIIDWESIGFSVSKVCKNGNEALEFIKNNVVDCLITDIKMSPISGIELLKLSKDINPNIKVVLVSAYSDFEFAKEAVKHSASDYLLKPLYAEELTQCMLKIKKELDEQKKSNMVIYNYQRNFINSVLKGDYNDSKNLLEILSEYNIDFTKDSKIALVGFMTEENTLNDAIVAHEKDAFYISLQRFINEMLPETNGFFLMCEDKIITYLLYTKHNDLSFEATVKNHIEGLKKTLKKYMEIAVEDVETTYIGGIEDLKNYSLNQSEYKNGTNDYDNYATTSVKAAKKYIEINYGEDISLEKISSMYYLSPGYFSKIFKRNFGITYVEFLVKYRMKKAKELLTETDHKIYTIGQLVGYENTKHFTKTFKAFYNISPKEYREKHTRSNQK